MADGVNRCWAMLLSMRPCRVRCMRRNPYILGGKSFHSTSVEYASQKTTAADEVQKFGLLSSEWWNQAGDFDILKAMNKLRVPWIKNTLLNDSEMQLIKPLDSFQILDVGCGGGLLSEPLARLGAKVTGVDVIVGNVLAADLHAKIDQNVARNVTYMCSTVEDMVDEYRNSFDAVVASEVIEHVDNQSLFIKSCSELMKLLKLIGKDAVVVSDRMGLCIGKKLSWEDHYIKIILGGGPIYPGGHLFITTINRTLPSMLFAKFAAEYILRIVPAGVHDWNKFVTTDELTDMLRSSRKSGNILLTY